MGLRLMNHLYCLWIQEASARLLLLAVADGVRTRRWTRGAGRNAPRVGYSGGNGLAADAVETAGHEWRRCREGSSKQDQHGRKARP